MKKIIIIVVVLIISIDSFSQVFGVSASKLAAINATTVTKNQFELEPGFGYYWASNYYDKDGKARPLSNTTDSTKVYHE